MARIEFNWSHPNPDGLTFCLYEDGKKIIGDIAEMHFSLLMDGKEQKPYTYHATAVNQFGLESVPSNPAKVDFFAPSAPTGFAASLIG